MRIACLHTAESNVAIFEAARPDGVRLRHAVRPDLLAAAEAEGLTPEIAAATAPTRRWPRRPRRAAGRSRCCAQHPAH